MKLGNYQTDTILYEGMNSLIFRGQRQSDHQPVVLKVLNQPYLAPEQVAWFKWEFDITHRLNPATPTTGPAFDGVVAAYSLERDQQQWLMALEDFGGHSLNQLGWAGHLELADFLKLAIQIVEILGQIHQRHIIHKDINPSNILINPESGQVKLIDFGISSILSRENPTLRNPNVLQGTLAYISPEQTGRMNRAIDYRSDFYSLGVTFYELLTGQFPFATPDAIEMVHAHIAQQPVSPNQRQPAIPQPLSDLVLKLLAKNAEDRYQSAQGLKADLENCLQQWQSSSQIKPFPLAQQDISDRFQISQKLYGREQEIEQLLAAFERVSQAAIGDLPFTPLEAEKRPSVEDAHSGELKDRKSELMLITGYPGIGKTALVQEIYKPLTRQRGYFISGKFDHLRQRNIPYAALIQAFRTLMWQILTESEANIETWRMKLLAALGVNGQVISEVIPEIELIIGSQPEVPTLGPAETYHRFNLVFQNFIRVFAQVEHPLVIFLDDLQWADGPSLHLLELLLSGGEGQSLFVIGAYRDNEVGEGHLLRLILSKLRQEGVAINQISLSPLVLLQVTQLIADTLDSLPEEVQPLAELALAKTGGNPFFLNEFLKSLYAEELLRFDHTRLKWQWNLKQIQRRDITDNIVELMAGKVSQLPPDAQTVLKLAACIGNRFDLAMVALMLGQPAWAAARALWPGVEVGLVLPLNDHYGVMDQEVPGLVEAVKAEYKFAHDRVQQAAYSLISEQERPSIHYQLGQLLLQTTQDSPEEREHLLFTIVNQLNLGKPVNQSQADRVQLAQLNLQAGHKAKASTAYEPALNYLLTGIELLTPESEASWHSTYHLTLNLHVEAAEAAYLSGQFEHMERLVAAVLAQAQDSIDKARAYDVQVRGYIAHNNPPQAIKTALEALNLLGIAIPAEPSQTDIGQALLIAQAAWSDREIESLINLPLMTAPDKLMALQIISTVMPITYVAAPALVPLLACTMVRLSIESGNAPASTFGYATYGLILCGALGDLDSGYQFGQLALKLLSHLHAEAYKARTYFYTYLFTSHWKVHLRVSLAPALEAYRSGLETGDIGNSALAALLYSHHAYLAGQELSELTQEMAQYSQAMRQFNQNFPLLYQELYRYAALAWTQPGNAVGQPFFEDYYRQMLPVSLQTQNRSATWIIYLNRLMYHYVFRQYSQALEAAVQAEPYLDAATGAITPPLYYLYDSLTRLALYPQADNVEQVNLLERVSANQQKLKNWAQHAPMNFEHKYYLVEAEQARVQGQASAARDWYDQAIDLAHQQEYLNEEALAYELAGKFYLATGQTRLARHYLRDAHHTYRRWGATVKVKDLEARYPQFLTQARSSRELPTLTTPTTNSGETASSILDLASVLKASQAISGEIVLDKLLATLMRIVIENAGAQRGYLLAEKQAGWVIEAEAEVKAEAEIKAKIDSGTLVGQVGNLSQAIIQYVARTRESVVLDDASREGLFTKDPYIRQNQPKSILCLPLLNQGKLNGILYLENNLTTGAFTPNRLEVLNILSSQAAISIENARLYTHQVELTEAASRFVPFEFLRFLNKQNISEAKLGDQIQQEMAILVSDIRSFTTLSEMMTPQENFDFVNAYLGQVGPIIREQRGFVVKYMGDGIMAVFPRRVEDALLTSIEQLRQVAAYNIERQRYGEMPIQIGIALHAGKIMLGIVGEAERIQADLLADAVNLAARLEGLTKLYGTSIVFSHEILARLQDPTQYNFRFLGKVQVKGRQEAVAIFDLFDGEPVEILQLKMRTRLEFEEGLNLYHHKKFGEACQLFKKVLADNPQDKAARLYLERSTHYLTNGVPDGWNGVMVLTEK